MSLGLPKMSVPEGTRRDIEAQVLLHVSCELCRAQLAQSHFVHEHIAGARSWEGTEVRELLRGPRVGVFGGASAPIWAVGARRRWGAPPGARVNALVEQRPMIFCPEWGSDAVEGTGTKP